MAQDMIKKRLLFAMDTGSKSLWMCGFAVCSLLFGVCCGAEEINDPTRLPASMLSSGDEVAPAPLPGLQSILIAPHHRSAIINGKLVKAGDKVGEERLIEVRERSVILNGPKGRRVITLFSEVKTTPSRVEVDVLGSTLPDVFKTAPYRNKK